MWRDLNFGIRQWRRKKLLAATIVLLLSAGIGANTLIFSFVNVVLLKPLPVRNPENLFLVQKVRVKQVRPDTWFFYRQFEQLAREKTVFSSVVAEQVWSDISFQPLSTSDSVRLITTQIVSPNYFSELGIRAIAGRVLTKGDAADSGDIPAVLSYQFWQRQFHKSRDIIGRTIRVKDYPFRVVGILPEEFHGLDVERAPDVRFPISAARLLTGATVDAPDANDPISFQILARLAPHVSPVQAATAELPTVQRMEEMLWRELWKQNSERDARETLEERLKYEQNYRLVLQPAARGISRLREQFSNALLLLTGAVGLLLIAICVNIAGLLLARSQERKQEIAVRVALGAARLQLFRQIALENLLLALPSAALGIGFAYGLAPSIVKLLPDPRGLVQYAATPQILAVQPDTRVLLFAIGVSFASVLVFGIAPAWRGTKLDLNIDLKNSGRSSTPLATGTVTIALQFAVAVVLLAGAVVMLRTFWNLEHLNPGFDRAHVVEFTVDPRGAGYSDAQKATFYRELKERVSEVPTVRSVSYASMGIMRGIGTMTTVVAQGKLLPERTFLNTSTNSVTPEYFTTLGIPLLAGRNLELTDFGKNPARVIVNRAFANFFFPHDGNVIGKAIVQGVDGTKPPTALIVGEVGTAKYRSFREHDPPIYYSVAKVGSTFMYVRTSGDPARIINAVREAIRRLDPRIPLIEVFTLEQEVQTSLWQERMVTVLSAFFGIVALLLSAIGLYGTLSYSVARRSRELGIRIAIGAQLRDIVQTVCARLFWSIAIGLPAGVLAAIFLLRLAKSLLFGVSPIDPLSFATVTCLLVLISAMAAVSSTRRAAKTDPTVALRQE